jgi:hypothetical protein
VTNTGTVTLTNVTVNDALVPACDFAIGTLLAGEHRSKTCSQANVRGSFTNTATVSGAVQGSPGETFEIDDDATVTVRYMNYLPLVTRN